MNSLDRKIYKTSTFFISLLPALQALSNHIIFIGFYALDKTVTRFQNVTFICCFTLYLSDVKRKKLTI